MKHVVVSGDLHERDIKPPQIFSRFRELSIEDAKARFSSPGGLAEIPCPACASDNKQPAFKKNEFQYNLCADCGSVFVSPRPRAEALHDYYRTSRAIHFRAQRLLQQTSEARRQLLLRGQANWLGRLVDEVGSRQARGFADLGTNYPIWFDEIRALGLFDTMCSVEPLPTLGDACRARGAAVAEADPVGLGAVTALEQLEHVHSPFEYLRRAWAMLAPGGMLFLTTRTISGFDLQILWDKAPYIYVPEHLNLPSIEGMGQLLERAGFQIVELSTPGQLDVELTLQAAAADPSIQLPPFIQYMLRRRDPDTQEDFQTFLQKNRLSSHLRVAAQRKG